MKSFEILNMSILANVNFRKMSKFKICQKSNMSKFEKCQNFEISNIIKYYVNT